jgi:predicted small lipoprotein YifL
MMQSKLMMRLVLVALALLTVLSLAACGPDKGPEEPTNGETPTTDDGGNVETPTDNETPTGDVLEGGPDLPTVTFPEQEYKVYVRDFGEDGIDYSLELYVGETLGATPTSLERAVYTRMSEIEDKYQIFFSVETDSAQATLGNKIDTSSKTGVDVYDLIGEHGLRVFSYAGKNQLIDLTSLPHNDFTQPWWSQDARENFATSAGRLFGMIGDISYNSVGSAFVMFFNKDIIENIPSLTSPYQLVYDDEWYFDTFEEYAVTTDSNMNGDNTGDLLTDSFGYGTGWWRGPVQALYSTGYRGLTRKGDGWRITVNNDTTNRAVSDLRDLLWNSGCAILDQSDKYENLKKAFRDNRVTFFDDHLSAANEFKATDINFGILPWPKYNDEVEEYYSAVDAGTQIYGVLRNTSDENAIKVSVILEELAYLGHRDIMPFYYETILSYQSLKDEDSINMMGIVHDNLVFDRGYYFVGVFDCFREAVIQKPGENKSLSNIYDSKEGGIEEGIKKWDELDEMLDKEN